MNDAARFRREMAPSEFLAAWLHEHGLSGAECEMLEEYYASYRRGFAPLMRHAYDRRLHPLVERVRALPTGARVLEIGSGCGTESLYLALQGARVTGVEVVQRMILTARARKRLLDEALGATLDCEFLHANVLELDASRPYDLIWMEEAFHHLEPRAEVVRKIAALLKPGGQLVIAEGNPFNPLYQLQLYWVRGLPRVEQRTDATGKVYQFGVERILSPWRLARWLRPLGIAQVQVEYHRFFPNMLLPTMAQDNRVLLWLDTVGHRWLPHVLKRFLCVHYLFVGRAGGPAAR